MTTTGRRWAVLAAALVVLAAAGVFFLVRRPASAPAKPVPGAASTSVAPSPPTPPPGVVVRDLPNRPAVAELRGVGGQRGRGKVRWLALPKDAGVVADVDLEGLAPGVHTVALEASGTCSPERPGEAVGEVVATVRGRARGRFTVAGREPASLPGQAVVVRDARGAVEACGVVSPQ